MAATGQRIHPAGSLQHPSPHAAQIAGTPLDPACEHDACGVGLVAAASGYASIGLLLRLFRTRSTLPFVVYRLALAVFLLIYATRG